MSRWILTVWSGQPDGVTHRHIEAPSPAAATIAIEEINDLKGGPSTWHIEEYTGTWRCQLAGCEGPSSFTEAPATTQPG